MKLLTKIFITMMLLGAGAGFIASASEKVTIGDFSKNKLKGWKSKSFVGETDYQLVEEDGGTILLADSNGTASGLGKKIRIDLNKTPFLNWRWKIENQLVGLDETTKGGDDYAARLYVVKSGGAFIWKTKALNYVWSSNQSKDRVWPNAFQPKNAIMLAVRGADDQAGVWVTEKRNVKEDLISVFGENIDVINAVAIMTDTDNSGRNARASYGEIYFTED